MSSSSFNLDQVWTRILQIGSISGLVSLVVTISDHVRKRRKFSFKFQSSSGTAAKRGNIEFYDLKYWGQINNESGDPNSIVQIGYVVWANKARTRSLSEGTNSVIKDRHSAVQLHTPVLFSPYEGKSLEIEFAVALTGTQNREIVQARTQLPGATPGMTRPTYEYQLVFTDINGRLFDQTGQLRSQKLMNLWWTLGNSRGKPFRYLGHRTKIVALSLWFPFRRFFWRLGI